MFEAKEVFVTRAYRLGVFQGQSQAQAGDVPFWVIPITKVR